MESKIHGENEDFLLTQFVQQVNKYPDKTAVIYENARHSYKEFNAFIDQSAYAIMKFESEKMEACRASALPLRIGVDCKNKLDALCLIFAILKIGGAFVPLGLADPEERREYIAKKAKLNFVLKTRYNYPNGTEDYSIESFNPTNASDAYILFTSGSTSKTPKGVRQTRLGLWGQIQSYTKDLHISSEDCLLNLATFSHDQAMVDCFGALLNGATVCLYDAQNLSVPLLHDFMQKQKVTIFSSIPSMFSLIFETIEDKNTFPALRIVTIGGEETKISHAQLFQKTCPANALLINGYGATEGSWFSYFVIKPDTDLSQLTAIPLGYATEEVKVKLVESAIPA